MNLVGEGTIDFEDVIERTTTDNFPVEAATVRLAKVREKKPFVTVHIRGKSKQKAYWNGGTYECASTCRINMGGSYNGMDSNGELCEDLTWLDVHEVVTEVKKAMNL